MSIWWAAPAFVGLVGVLLLVGGLGHLFKLRIVSGGFRFLFGGVVLAAAAVVALIGMNLQTYTRLTHEQLAAEVTIRQIGPDSYFASVAKADRKGNLLPPKEYPLTGDTFRMEADVVTFKPWANIIGVDALYRFNRIQGRYDSEAKETANPPRPWSMRETTGVDLFSLPLGSANPLKQVDAEFLNGFAVPLADGAVYDVSMSQKGLIPRPKNQAAIAAVAAHRASVANLPLEPGPPDAASGAGTTPASPNLPPAQTPPPVEPPAPEANPAPGAAPPT
ncbi:MAG: hypothetical protein GC155_13815 [Alphaproteobacteria bacterium]|nr:hypothetical protein [Alphaproteobacteria bacterium]